MLKHKEDRLPIFSRLLLLLVLDIFSYSFSKTFKNVKLACLRWDSHHNILWEAWWGIASKSTSVLRYSFPEVLELNLQMFHRYWKIFSWVFGKVWKCINQGQDFSGLKSSFPSGSLELFFVAFFYFLFLFFFFRSYWFFYIDIWKVMCNWRA